MLEYSFIGRQRYIWSKKDANDVPLLKVKPFCNIFSCADKSTFHMILLARFLYFTTGNLDFLYKVRQLHLL